MSILTESIAKTPKQLEDTRDPLSRLLQRLRLTARVFLRADFCGIWGVDTSGERRVPFHLVTRGSGWLHQSGQSPRELVAGELVMFPHDGPHILSNADTPPEPAVVNQPPPKTTVGSVTSLMCGYFAFDRKAADPLLAGLPGTIVLDLKDSARHHDTATLMQLWTSEAGNEDLGCDAAIDQLAYVVFIHLLRAEIRRGSLRGPIAALADARIGPVLHRIHEVPGAPHAVEDLAKRAGMSRSSFAQRFKAQTGMTPGRYVLHWRMHTACDLLEDTEQSIAAIAEMVGYASEVAFRKAFSSYIGIPPARFRRNVKT